MEDRDYPESPGANAFRARHFRLFQLNRIYLCIALSAFAGWFAISFMRIGVPGPDIPSAMRIGQYFEENAFASLSALFLAACTLAILFASGQAFRRWLGPFRRAEYSPVLSLFTGYAMVSAAFLGISLLGLAFRDAIRIAFIAGVALSLPLCLGPLRALVRRTTGYFRAFPGMSMTVALPILLMAVMAAIPETNGDCMEYHLGFPEQVLIMHKLFGSEMYQGWMHPMAVDILNMVSLAFGCDAAAKVLRPLLCLAGGIAFATSLNGRPLALTAIAGALLAVLLPSARWTIILAKNDAIITGTLLAASAVAVRALLSSSRGGERRMAVLAGVLLGFLASSKLVELPVALAFYLAIPLALPIRGRASWYAFSAAAGIASFAPWAFRSWLFTADPVNPIFMYLFPVIYGHSAESACIRESFGVLTSTSDNYTPLMGFLREIISFLANSAPFLVAVPLIFLAPRQQRVFSGLSAVFLSCYLCMVLTIGNPLQLSERFAYSIFAGINLVGLMFFIGALPYRKPEGKALLLGILICANVVIVFLAREYVSGYNGGHFLDYVTGMTSREGARFLGTGSYGRIVPKLGRLYAKSGTNDAIITLGGSEVLGMPGRVLGVGFSSPFFWRALRESPDMGRLEIKYRQARAGWVVHHLSRADWERFAPSTHYWDERMLRLYHRFALTHLELVAVGSASLPYGDIWVYRVHRKGGLNSKEMLFLPGSEHAFYPATKLAMAGDLVSSRALFDEIEKVLPGILAVRLYRHLAMGEKRESAAILARVRREVSGSKSIL